jgi:prolyl-tRNA editing enzyme YbaK/EbsC (Cys-tRNA(Pro) deacylase)
MLTDQHLQLWLTQKGIPAKLVYPGVPTPTVPDAANALGVKSEQIIKSLVFLCDGESCLVVAAGEVRISYKKLADYLRLSRRKVKMASPEQALEITGFPVGAMPPFGHKEVLRTFVDADSLQGGYEVYYGGGGTKEALLELTLETLLEVTRAAVVPLAETVPLTESVAESSEEKV